MIKMKITKLLKKANKIKNQTKNNKLNNKKMTVVLMLNKTKIKTKCRI